VVVGVGCGVVDLGDEDETEAEPTLLDGDDKRGWVDARFARCGRVAGDDMCARRPSGCWLVMLWTFCPWWPWSPNNPLLGVHSLRRETSSRICVAFVSVHGLFLLCRCRGLGGGIPDDEWSLWLGAGWLCCAPIDGCGCLGRNLAALAWSRFYWTTEGPWASSEIQFCVDGAPQTWRTSKIIGIALVGSWVDPRCNGCIGRQPKGR
jgi:hypothetical protein